SDLGAGHSDFGQPGSERILPGDEGGPTGRTTLLAVEVGKSDSLIGDAIDTRCSVAHHASAVVANIPETDVVTPQDQKIWLFSCHLILAPLGLGTQLLGAPRLGHQRSSKLAVKPMLFACVSIFLIGFRTANAYILVSECPTILDGSDASFSR